MRTIVQKYGGTSVGDIDRIQNVAKKIVSKKNEGYRVVVVVSAMGKTTDKLLNLARQISNNLDKRDLDMLLSTGEQVSISLLSMALKEIGQSSICLTGFQAGINTIGQHTKSKISNIDINRVNECLDSDKIVIVAGFQGINENKDITTLGRGGSDTTAVALASKLGCACEIYTDVDGIYSVDPRIYKEAKQLDCISYEDMIEMASLGAGVMETRAVEIAYKYNVEIYVSNSINNNKGTYIGVYDTNMETKTVKGLSIDDKKIIVSVDNIPMYSQIIADIFDQISKENINVGMISQSIPINGSISLSFTASEEDRYIIESIINELKLKYNNIDSNVQESISNISVVGMGLMNQSGIIGKLLMALSENNIKFKQMTTSEKSISYTIDSKDKEKAVKVLAKVLDL